MVSLGSFIDCNYLLVSIHRGFESNQAAPEAYLHSMCFFHEEAFARVRLVDPQWNTQRPPRLLRLVGAPFLPSIECCFDGLRVGIYWQDRLEISSFQ